MPPVLRPRKARSVTTAFVAAHPIADAESASDSTHPRPKKKARTEDVQQPGGKESLSDTDDKPVRFWGKRNPNFEYMQVSFIWDLRHTFVGLRCLRACVDVVGKPPLPYLRYATD
jgi:hypothetical protein